MGSEDQLATALIAVLIIAAAYCTYHWIVCGYRDGFVSARAQEVYEKSRDLFKKSGDVTYSAYKSNVAGVDPVLYTDVRGLWKTGGLTPDAVESVI